MRKSGKSLELLLSSGGFFFNVSSPVKEGETLNIRTATMVVGIRGTSGWFKAVDRWSTEIYVLEGTVQCSVSDPVTGQAKEATIQSGEMAVATAYPQDYAGDKCDIVQEKFGPGDIDGFVLEELARDPELCAGIFEKSGLDVLSAVEATRERREQDEQKMQEVLDRIGEQQAEQDSSTSPGPVWGQEEPAPDPPPASSGRDGQDDSGDKDDQGDSGDRDDTGGSVPDAAWYSGAVQYVYAHGMMGGSGSADTFVPDSPTSRGMLATILHRMEGLPSAPGAAFADVPSGQWYADAVAWASANGIIAGYGNGNFGPDDPITREQLASILYRYARYKGYPVTISVDASAFPDGNTVSSYAADAVDWAVGTGLLQGIDGALSPAGGATRAQGAAILMRFCENVAPTYTLTVVSAMDVMCEPRGILALEDGSFLVTDSYNKVIWRVADGASTVYAGSDTVAGSGEDDFIDGPRRAGGAGPDRLRRLLPEPSGL